jgi:hypothetical protein
MWNLRTGKTLPEQRESEYLAKHEQNFSYFGITTSTTLVGQLHLICLKLCVHILFHCD